MSHHDDCIEMLGRGLDPRHRMLIQEEVLDELTAYKTARTPAMTPFVLAVLGNNLVEAAVLTNYDSVLTLPAVVAFCQAYLPAESWGSPEAVAVWLGQPVPEGVAPGSNAEHLGVFSALSVEVQKALGELNAKDPRLQRFKTLAKILEGVPGVVSSVSKDAEKKEEIPA